MTNTTQHIYTYPDEADEAFGARSGGPYADSSAPYAAEHERRRHITLVPVLGASGGYGASTFALHLTRTFNSWLYRVCIVDADFAKGGLDVLAGCEESEGLRWHNVKAPLGRIDAPDIGKDLVQWEEVPLLAYHAWEVVPPRWWEMKAVLDALALKHDVIILDCGQSIHPDMVRAWESMNAAVDVQPLLLFQLGALGITRCYSTLRNWTDATAGKGFKTQTPVLFIAPARSAQMAKKRVGPMTEKEAEQYFETVILGRIPYKVANERHEKNGWGVAPTDYDYRTMMGVLIRAMAQMCIYNWEKPDEYDEERYGQWDPYDNYDPYNAFMEKEYLKELARQEVEEQNAALAEDDSEEQILQESAP
ncbi:hypothetical protein B9G54_04680 [Alloscardovia macacae]|uniref:Uncharacterized protein n=1 Tax=Alloscardovia macacae TaxID=1160091 RepID=A0A1Y2SUH6_9BIFI|nr:hypothetical protein [Alloscardovia macacae]OTA26489.1 hypothetical protein B9G54_04680 [Alloscardovia macacae]OTA29833.1 hypothetical protein B9T39_01770 [Alloscardovia macacae]